MYLFAGAVFKNLMDHIIHISEKGIVNKSVVRSAFNVSPGRYLLKLTKSNRRSLPQNAFYWGVCVPTVKQGLRDAGYNDIKTNEDAHEVIKHLFLKKQIPNINDGNVIEITGSTAELTTTEFMELIAEVQQWASEFLNCVIPDPGQQVEIFN